ncbi:hypothetical protein Taro_001008 [Colocasia esculenta]|uniref:Uncharacterized protein n=1 Tax=Colocasia esculenta TaxID=4460 RepID=A0A843TCD0_COLES|nr:hypothetical protein [Colocasia esculenta]
MPHFRKLGPESLKVSGMGLRLYGPQEWCWLVSTVSWLVVVERQLDLSSVAARLRGSPVWFVRGSFPTEPVTCEAHFYSSQVRESRRLLALRLVQSRTVAELGLHHQQCNLFFLFTSGYAPGKGEQEASRPSSSSEPHHSGVGSAPPAV